MFNIIISLVSTDDYVTLTSYC